MVRLPGRRRGARVVTPLIASRCYQHRITRSGHADAGGPTLEALVRNTSEHQVPVFDAKLHWYRGSEPYGTPNPEPLLDVPGYENTARSRTFPPGADLSACGAFLTFRDAAGFGWLRGPGTALAEHHLDELDDAAATAIRARADGTWSQSARP
jgi:hypothetical protein